MALLRTRGALLPETLTLRRFASSTPTSGSPATDSSKPSPNSTHGNTVTVTGTHTHLPVPSNGPQHHAYLPPNPFVESWSPPRTPKEAQARLVAFRRDYKLQVKGLRKAYAAEVEADRLEKQRKNEARLAALRLENEQRKAQKALRLEAKAAERKVAEEKLRQILLKERTEKFEYWKMKEMKREEKNKEKKELLKRRSSLWIGENELQERVHNALLDTNPL